jgi:hypothetical protein
MMIQALQVLIIDWHSGLYVSKQTVLRASLICLLYNTVQISQANNDLSVIATLEYFMQI